MKNFSVLFSILFILVTEISGQSNPPTGIRGTYVDCAQDLILQIHNGNAIVATDFLDQMRSRNISYLALFGLDHTSNTVDFPNGYVMGDPVFENDISYFVREAHLRDIKVGVVVSDKSFVAHTFTPRLNWQKLAVRSDCFPVNARQLADVDANEDGGKSLIGEIAKAAVRVANYNSTAAYFGGYIDYISVEYEYWTRGFYVDHPHYADDAVYTKEYHAYQDLLVLMNFIRENVVCSGKYHGLRSEMELRLKPFSSVLQTVPSPQVQANEIDRTNVDRILMVDYHQNPAALFGYSCDNLFWLGGSSGKPQTEILPLLSAESLFFLRATCINYTPASPYWDNFLGDYLASGNSMGDAEQVWYDDFLAAGNSSCANCSCNYSNGDNQIKGFMWFTSSILIGNHIYRKRFNDGIIENKSTFYNDAANMLSISGDENFQMATIADISGKTIFTDRIRSKSVNLPDLAPGIYIGLVENTVTNKSERIKFVVR